MGYQNFAARAGALIVAAAASAPALTHELKVGRLPVGDGKLATEPKAGHVFACQTRFRGGPGLQRSGAWVAGDTWDPALKPVVSGEVTWPAQVTVSLEGGQRIVRANGLPKHPTGVFPIARTDHAFQYDPNPNRVRQHDVLLSLPAMPQLAASPACVPMGPIGFALSGAYVYNALDAQGRDAPVHEMQDRCHGHPEGAGRYHYHNWSPCLIDAGADSGRHSDLVGVALDGFGLFGPRGEGGKAMTNADLDACHGHTHDIDWNGGRATLYHYHFTAEYPYTLGCFKGTPQRVAAPTAMRQGKGAAGTQPKAGAALETAARELGIEPQALRRALGAPPPDFARAAAELGIDEARLRDVMRRARGR